jgi:hypothetical protein
MGLIMNPTREFIAVLAGLSLAALAAPLAAQGNVGATATTEEMPLDVVVTADSPPDWKPPEQLALQAAGLVESYLSALDAGDYARAYGMMTVEDQKETPAARFHEEARKFNDVAGHLLRRRMLVSTWAKDPPGAPKAGIYVVFDVAAQFANVDRECGSVMLYQPPAGGSFKVMRSENYFMDNRTAQQIELSRSHQALVEEWARISASCPKFSWDPTS